MEAKAQSLTFLGTENKVVIPFFQRGYVWDKANWEDLLSDLLETNKSIFLGSLILKQQIVATGKPKEVSVIDGQQRLTTLTILLKAIFDSFDTDTRENCSGLLKTIFFYKENPIDRTYHVKIKHSRIDSVAFNKVINGEISKEEYDKIIVSDSSNKVSSVDNKILQCYKYFLEEFKGKSKNIVEELFNRLLDISNRILVVIDLTEKEDEQAIFDTINSAGVRLSGADIIKNALFQKAILLLGDEEQVLTLYKETWDNLFMKDNDSITYWETSRPTGRLMRDNIEILLHSIAVIKGFFNPEKHSLSDLANLYKNHISELDKDHLIRLINEIAEYAQIYRTNILEFDKSTLFSFTDDYQRLFHILNRCEISTFHPYILHIFFKYKDNDSEIKKELKKLEVYIVRRMIVNAETKSYNKTCKEFITNESSLDSRLNEIQSPDKLLEGLCDITNKNAALLLFWVELNRRNNDSMESLKELKFNYSLEHIMPQKWEEHWASCEFVDSDGKVVPLSDDSKENRYAKVYSIGNMTLLNSSLNTSLRNYEFDRKIRGEGKKKGIKDYADLSITKNDILRPFESGNLVWNEFSIENRTKNLYNEIISIWN